MRLSVQHLFRSAFVLVAVLSGLIFTAAPSSAIEHHVVVTNTTDRGVWVTVYRCNNSSCDAAKDGAYCAPPGQTVRSGHNVMLYTLKFEIKEGASCNGPNAVVLGDYFRQAAKERKTNLFTVKPAPHNWYAIVNTSL